MVVLPLALLGQGEALRLDRRAENIRVLAVDSAAGLLAVDSGEREAPYLELAQDDHPLYLARDLLFVTAAQRSDGWVDGFQEQTPDSGAIPLTPVRLQQPIPVQGGALLDARTAQLLGTVVFQPQGREQRLAVDAGVLRALLASAGRSQPRSLSAFLQDYRRSTPEGMLLDMQRRLAAGDIGGAAALAETLLSLDRSYRERALPLLENVLNKEIRNCLDRQDPAQALQWLERVRVLLGERAPFHFLYSATYLALGDFERAQRALHEAARLDPGSSGQAAAQMRQLIDTAGRQLPQQTNGHRLAALLQEALRLEPDCAAYHHRLGLLYLQQGNPAAASASLGRAMQLDSSLVGPLSALLQQVRDRLDDRLQARIPFQRANDILFVNVTINGQPQASRFILDTGASHTVIARALADQLGIQIPAQAPQVWIQTANNRTLATRVTLDSVNLGGAVVRNVPALVMDTLGDVDGLLGLSFLKFFNVAIEQQEGYVTLTRH